jgi:hypothetical protein
MPLGALFRAPAQAVDAGRLRRAYLRQEEEARARFPLLLGKNTQIPPEKRSRGPGRGLASAGEGGYIARTSQAEAGR